MLTFAMKNLPTPVYYGVGFLVGLALVCIVLIQSETIGIFHQKDSDYVHDEKEIIHTQVEHLHSNANKMESAWRSSPDEGHFSSRIEIACSKEDDMTQRQMMHALERYTIY